MACCGEVDVHSGKFDSSLTGIISGAGSLVKDGTGQLSLTEDNTYSGGTQIAAGKVALDANAALGTGKATFAQNTELSLGISKGVSVANDVQVDGAIKVHSGSFDSSLDGVVSGVGSLVKDGTGELSLTKNNSYEGGTIVNSGTLAIKDNANLGKAETGVTVSNATLLLNGDIAIERKVTLAGTTATLNTAQDTSSSLDDAVSGTAKLIKTGDGTLTLNTANTYAGGTQIAKGTLAISNDASLGGKAGKFGVSRFDGQTFTSFTESKGLHGPGCNLLIDRNGIIWAGTNDGLFRFDGSSFVEFKLPDPEITDPSYKWVRGKIWCIMEDSHGNLWFGRDGYGACKYDGESYTHFTTKDGLCTNPNAPALILIDSIDVILDQAF